MRYCRHAGAGESGDFGELLSEISVNIEVLISGRRCFIGCLSLCFEGKQALVIV